MSIPVMVTMKDGTKITLYRRDGTGTMEGLREPLFFRAWQATAEGASAFGTTEDAAIAALLDKLYLLRPALAPEPRRFLQPEEEVLECPQCPATPGEPCENVTAGGHKPLVRPHKSRTAAWQARGSADQ
jgi:hypothetical protein